MPLIDTFITSSSIIFTLNYLFHFLTPWTLFILSISIHNQGVFFTWPHPFSHHFAVPPHSFSIYIYCITDFSPRHSLICIIDYTLVYACFYVGLCIFYCTYPPHSFSIDLIHFLISLPYSLFHFIHSLIISPLHWRRGCSGIKYNFDINCMYLAFLVARSGVIFLSKIPTFGQVSRQRMRSRQQ